MKSERVNEMKHINRKNLTNCIKITGEEFAGYVKKLCSDVDVEYDLYDTGWNCYKDGVLVEPEKIMRKLSNYFDMNIVSIHTDNCGPCHVWLEYV